MAVRDAGGAGGGGGRGDAAPPPRCVSPSSAADSHGFGGQGYGGGIYGLAERTGAGGTGSPGERLGCEARRGGTAAATAAPPSDAAPADMGVRSGDAACGALVPTARFFDASDFAPGAEIRFEHTPDLPFVLGDPDAFTAAFLDAAQRAAEAGDGSAASPLDVYVPENSHPVPSLPLEAVSGEADSGVAAAPTAASALERAALLVAKVLAGVSRSAYALIRQGDKRDRGYAPIAAVVDALGRFGVAEPAVPHAELEALLAAFTLGAGGRISGDASALAGGSNAATAGAAPGGHESAASAWQPVVTGGTTLDRAGAAVEAGQRARGIGPTGSPISATGSAPAKRSVSGTTIGTLDDPLAGPFFRCGSVREGEKRSASPHPGPSCATRLQRLRWP